MSLFEEAISMGALHAALDQASENRAGPGADGVTVAVFAANAETELRQLNRELAAGEYRPRPARTLQIPKAGGGHRRLAISSVRDRVVQHALAATLSRALDDALHPSAYAWRRGRSAHDALAVIDRAMASGREWVFRGDIEAFFDRIPPDALMSSFRALVSDDSLADLVARVQGAGALAGRQIADPSLGTGQGSPLSPLLANVYLIPFDQAMQAAAFECVRYGDDLCVATWTRDGAEHARAVAREALERLRLCLNASKEEIRHRGESFTFLGFTFHSQGRRAGDKARRRLAEAIEKTLRERPRDGVEELDEMLSGWATYYGSLAGVELPDALRVEAEARIAARVDRQKTGEVRTPRDEARPSSEGDGATHSEGLAPWASDSDEGNRWQSAAIRLSSTQGTPDEAAVRESLAASLAVDAAAWSELASALCRFDGRASAEQLAALGRFGDAGEAERIERPAHLSATPSRPRGVAVIVEDAEERPRFVPEAGDAERLLDLFGGAEHAHMRDVKVGDRTERQRMMQSAGVEQGRAHLAGTFWLGVYPLRGNHSVRFAAVRVVEAAKSRTEHGRHKIPEAVNEDARRIGRAFEALGLHPVYSVEPGRARVVWVLFAQAITAARARALLAAVLHRVGAAPPEASRELVPAQDTTRPEKPGTGVLLPLGLDPRTGERAWLCDADGRPVSDPCAWLRARVPDPADAVAEALGVRKALPALRRAQVPSPAPSAPSPAAKTPEAERGSATADVVAMATSPLRDVVRAQEVYAGCAVLRHFVDQAVSGAGLATSERMWVADVLGRLGNEAVPAVEAVFRHLDDWKPGMAGRYVTRLYPSPTSCGKVRQRWPELTARVGCDCRFRVPPGAYPTPVLHALGAAEVPGLGARVKEAAARGGVAKAAVEAMNEGRKELGAKASALCARLADLKRQRKVLDRVIASVEADLDALLDEAGDTELETPSGTLKRVTEGGARRFVLEV